MQTTKTKNPLHYRFPTHPWTYHGNCAKCMQNTDGVGTVKHGTYGRGLRCFWHTEETLLDLKRNWVVIGKSSTYNWNWWCCVVLPHAIHFRRLVARCWAKLTICSAPRFRRHLKKENGNNLGLYEFRGPRLCFAEREDIRLCIIKSNFTLSWVMNRVWRFMTLKLQIKTS